ncbi:MAG: hypothetical protein R3D00_31405 [Bacteroidia bacterium]
MKITLLWITTLVIGFASCNPGKTSFRIQNNLTDPPVKYAISRLASLDGRGLFIFKDSNPDWTIITQKDNLLGDEAYTVHSSGKDITITGGDAVGVMYGLLYVKTQLEAGKMEIEDIEESPRFSFRALKFNLPWDSYRNGEALQLHEETCRDTVFWHAFLDMMAENRFNKLTLWNLHPFNYLVKTEKYPEACGFSDEEMAQWESFWTALFRMAKERGIETYLINWNIFVSPEFAEAHHVAEYCIKGDYFVEQGDTSEIIKDYTRESVKAVIDKYPDLSGLGITLGEGMGGMTAGEREKWLLDSYVAGMRMASRKVKFIHRVPLSAGKGSGGSTDVSVEKMTRETLDSLSCVDGPINIELKFNWSHPYSSTKLEKVHGGKLTDAYWNPSPQNYKLAWMIRNEDFFVLRWGQPEFIREHISQNGHEYVNGYYVGSECYIPAKDYITALPNTSYRYAFDRQWMYYQQWGRLLYNPATEDEVFANAFESRFPEKGKSLFEAQKKVSRVPLIIGSWWNATWDYTLYSEGMLSLMGNDKMKLLSLDQMSKKQPLEPDYLSIPEFLAGEAGSGKITPLVLADSIDSFCKAAIGETESIHTENNNDLLYEVSDIQTWAYLGMYFSHKLRAAVAYQQYQDSGEKTALEESVKWLEMATGHWDSVVKITTPVYQPMPLQHYERNNGEYFHWSAVAAEVEEELDWLKSKLMIH